MITVVSLNPSIDRTLTVKQFQAGCTNRATSVRVDAGGKGINVCLHLKALGVQDVQCIGLMRSADEAMFSAALQTRGIRYRWLTLPGHVRTNTKICSDNGELTEINEAGEAVSGNTVEEFIALSKEAFSVSDTVVLTGSVPPGVPKDIYAQLIRITREYGCICLLDADGDALRHAIDAKPHFVKPNRSEIERLFNKQLPGDNDLFAAAQELMSRSVPCGCISLGSEGAVFFSDAWVLKLPAMDVPVRSTVGAGDAMTAAFAMGLAEKMGEKEIFRLAIASGSAAVMSEGTQGLDKSAVDQLLKRIPQPAEIH